jgi:hypothetical protein
MLQEHVGWRVTHVNGQMGTSADTYNALAATRTPGTTFTIRLRPPAPDDLIHWLGDCGRYHCGRYGNLVDDGQPAWLQPFLADPFCTSRHRNGAVWTG